MDYPFGPALQAEYAALWAGMQIRMEREPDVRATARRILADRPRYDEVSRRTGVPWFVVGILHAMECSLSFSKHLHNGDPMVDRDGRPLRTVQVPKGRGPFKTWEDSAVDALTIKGYEKISDWSLERIAWACERYNGWGYRRAGINVHSPYLWSFTTVYERGKYVRDHVWSAVAVSKQCGAMAILKMLIELEPTQVDLDHAREASPAWPKAEVAAAAAISPVKSAAESRTIKLIIGSVLAWLVEKFEILKSILPDVQTDVQSTLDPIQSLLGMLRINASSVLVSLGVALAVWGLWRHAHDRLAKKKYEALFGALEGKDGGAS